MDKSLQVLIIEDSTDDVLLIMRSLQQGGFDPSWTKVDDPITMAAALTRQKWDLIISDFAIMPQFNGLDVLEIANKHELDVPFIIVSGTIGEDTAVKAMKSGAHDYIMKDKLARLVPAVERELREAENRRKQKEIEKSHAESKERLDQFMKSATEGFILFDSQLRTIEINNAALVICDIRRSIIDKPIQKISLLSDDPDNIKKCKAVIETGKAYIVDNYKSKTNGIQRHSSIKAFKVGDGLGMIITDISDQKRAEQQIQKDLREKEVLLKEIHHRVKNNLQIISSLLSLQSMSIKEKNVLNIFNESRNRVRSMALVHEELYHSKDLAHIDFASYVKNLVHSLYRAYKSNSASIQLKLDIHNIAMGIDLAVPCGLIINELISNSLKYAFPKKYRKKGIIQVALHEYGKDMAELIIQDNGIGFPKDIDPKKNKSLGLHLVTLLAEDQLGGTIQLNKNSGTTFKILFKTDIFDQ